MRSVPSRPWRTSLMLLLAALLLALAVGAALYLSARYDTGDLYSLLYRVALHISRKRLAVVVLASVPLVWLAVRWRTARPAAWVALLAYLGGSLGDALVLLSLEPLGISYGPVLLPLALLAGLRCALALGLAVAASLLGPHKHRPFLRPLLHVGAQALLLAAVVDGFAIEPNSLTMWTVAVHDPYASGARPLRIVQISDWHLERANDLAWRTVETVNGLQPDLIVLTGDYFSSELTDDAQAQADFRALVAALRARHGIYAVSGNSDPQNIARTLLYGLPVTPLEDRWQALEVDGRPLVLAGVALDGRSRSRREMRQALAGVAAGMPGERLSVLLCHTPDLVPEAAAAGFDLYLAGHTHGGQVRLPVYGALGTSSLYGKRYEMGAYQVQGMLAYVSRGIGMVGWLTPRVRFLCPPEVVCYDVT